MIGSILVATLDPHDHRDAFGIGGTDPGGCWDEVLHGPATGPALLNRLAAIPLTLPDDIDDLLDTVAPLHRPEATTSEGGSAAGAPAGGGWSGSWRKAGGRAWASGLRRTLRHRRGTPAPWRTPVEGAQASVAASEAERIALGSTGLAFGTVVAALGQIAKAEAPEEVPAGRPLHMPQAEAPSAGAAEPVPAAGGDGQDAAVLFAATYAAQAMAVGTTIIPTAFAVLGGAVAGGVPLLHAGFAQGSLFGVLGMVAPAKAVASPAAAPELLAALPWVALSRGEAAKGSEAPRAAEQPRQPDRAPHSAEAGGGGGGSGQVVVPAAETPAPPPASRPSHQEEAATGIPTVARPEPVLAGIGFRAEPSQPIRPALQEEHARSESTWSPSQDRGVAAADLRVRGGTLDRDDADRGARATGAPKADPGQPDKAGGGTGRSADLAGPGDPVSTAKVAAVASGKDSVPDGLGPAAPGPGIGLLPSGTRPGNQGVAPDDRAGSGLGKEGVPATGPSLPPVQALDPTKPAAGLAAATDRPAAVPDRLPGDQAVAAPGGGPGRADGLPPAGGVPASFGSVAAGLLARPDGVPRADQAAAPDIAPPGPTQVPTQAGQPANREAGASARPDAALPPGGETPAPPGAITPPHLPMEQNLAGRAGGPEAVPSVSPGALPAVPPQAGTAGVAPTAAKDAPALPPPTANMVPDQAPTKPGLPLAPPAPERNPATLPDPQPAQVVQGDRPGLNQVRDVGDGVPPAGQAKSLVAEDHGGGSRPEGIGAPGSERPAVLEPGRQPEAPAPKLAEPPAETVPPQAGGQAIVTGPDLPGKPPAVAGRVEDAGKGGAPPDRAGVEAAAPVTPDTEPPLDNLLAIFDPAVAGFVPGLVGGGPPAMPPFPAGLPGEGNLAPLGPPGLEGDLFLL